MSTGIRTHKENRRYFADYDHDWPVTSVPRKTSFYQPVPADEDEVWSHFIASVKSRAIPWDVVRDCIENGDVYKAEGNNRYRFLWTCPETAATFSLIVELRAEAFAYSEEKHYAITVYRIER